MKKLYHIFLLGVLIISCLNLKANSIDTIVLNLRQPTAPPAFELNEGAYWTETYNSTDYPFMEFDLFKFTHIPAGFGGTDVGSGMSYWDGFTYSTNGDSLDYGIFGDSEGWLAHQWGCMAGGGIKTDAQGHILKDENGKVLVEKGLPYLAAYWGYWIEEMGGAPCLQALFTDGKAYKAVGVYINNHPWPYYGNIHGDGFARPFAEGDCFKLIIHGFNEQLEDIGVTVEHTLAEFTNGELRQSPDWEWIDLSPLGEVYGFYFTMTSTDVHNNVELGPNTAVYFCLDKLMVSPVSEEIEIPGRPINLAGTATETSIHFSWAAGSGIAPSGYNVYLNDELAATVSATAYLFEELNPATAYKIGVEAFNETTAVSAQAFITVSTIDETAPTKPANLQATPTATTIALSWTVSSDNVGVTGYNIFVDGVRVKRVTDTSYTITLLDPDTEYWVEVEAFDAADNRSERSAVQVSTLSQTIGIQSKQNPTVHIYPNPFADVLCIEINEDLHIDMYDVNGEKVLSKQLTQGANRVNTASLPKGVYILRCGNMTIKIIK